MEPTACPHCFSSKLKVNCRLCTPGVRRKNEPLVISRQHRNIEFEKQWMTYEGGERDKSEGATRRQEYGPNFVQYTAEEVKEITDNDFLYKMYLALHSTGQQLMSMNWNL